MTKQIPLPDFYLSATEAELRSRIGAARQRLGKDLVILAHHYQRPEVVALGDSRGDSLKLAQFAAEMSTAKYVVFCGVHFMAESADILKTGDQRVILPDLGAGCDMADMADVHDVSLAWDELVSELGSEEILPVTYVNSSAALKAFVGKRGGVVCTSSNAERIVSWALTQKRRIMFFPDQHLGRNTCRKLGILADSMKVWDPLQPSGGLSAAEIRASSVFLWKGHCPVHMMFMPQQIDALRARDPAFKIVVHPECTAEVVEKADFVGSTEYIVRMVHDSPAGSKWGVGTEMNLVNRLASENPDKVVLSVNKYMCLCGTMNRIDLPHLAWALDGICEGVPPNVIEVHEPDRTWALSALRRMLDLSM